MFAGVNFLFVKKSGVIKPVNTVAPAVSGATTFSSTLTTTNGTWTGPPASYTYQWYRSPSTVITGATTNSYTIADQNDVGKTIYCTVTATNAKGSTNANSNSSATVTATVPAAPTVNSLNSAQPITPTSVQVYYTAQSNGGATVTKYTAVSSPGGITGIDTTGGGSVTVTGLSATTNYTFTVYATNSVGNSASSTASSIARNAVMLFLSGNGLNYALPNNTYNYVAYKTDITVQIFGTL